MYLRGFRLILSSLFHPEYLTQPFFRHFEKNSRTKKLKTQGKNSITQGKNSKFWQRSQICGTKTGFYYHFSQISSQKLNILKDLRIWAKQCWMLFETPSGQHLPREKRKIPNLTNRKILSQKLQSDSVQITFALYKRRIQSHSDHRELV